MVAVIILSLINTEEKEKHHFNLWKVQKAIKSKWKSKCSNAYPVFMNVCNKYCLKESSTCYNLI